MTRYSEHQELFKVDGKSKFPCASKSFTLYLEFS